MSLVNTVNAPVIGVDMVHCAVLKTDPANTPGMSSPAPCIYSDLNPLIHVRTASVSSANNQSTEWFDNAPAYAVMSKGEKTVTIARAHITNEVQRLYLGLQLGDDGVTIEGKDSLPPYVAIGWRRKKFDDHYDYVWYFKGILNLAEEAAESMQGTPAVQLRTLTGTFVTRDADGAFGIKMSTDDDTIPSTVFENWFTLTTINKLWSEVVI